MVKVIVVKSVGAGRHGLDQSSKSKLGKLVQSLEKEVGGGFDIFNDGSDLGGTCSAAFLRSRLGLPMTCKPSPALICLPPKPVTGEIARYIRTNPSEEQLSMESESVYLGRKCREIDELINSVNHSAVILVTCATLAEAYLKKRQGPASNSYLPGYLTGTAAVYEDDKVRIIP